MRHWAQGQVQAGSRGWFVQLQMACGPSVSGQTRMQGHGPFSLLWSAAVPLCHTAAWKIQVTLQTRSVAFGNG